MLSVQKLQSHSERKKINMKKKIFITSLLLTLFVTGCNSGGGTSMSGGGSGGGSSQDVQKEDFKDIFFDDLIVTYDGQSHTLGEVRGAPSDATVTYANRNSYTDVGSYKATATIEKENYNPLSLDATLTITPATFSGLTYESVSVTYDGKEHIDDVQLSGFTPEGTSTKEIVKDENNQIVTSAVEVGTYTYTCEITNKNYDQLTLSATLTIKEEKSDMPVFVSSDGTIYFANGLDNGYLYAYDSTAESTVTRIDYAAPKEFNKYNSSSALYIAGSMFLNSVKEVSNGSTNVIYTDSNIDDFVRSSNSAIYYYSSNSLKSSKSGIYKVDASNVNDEPVVTKVFEGKTDNLAIYNDYLYFSNGNDGNHLYKMNLSTKATSLVLNEKVHEFIIDDDKLYCTVNGLLNDYIGYIDLSSGSTEPIKLTHAAGEFLTIKNGYLYFHYTDLFAAIDASKKGIWCIDLSNGTEKQILANENVNGFDVESSSSLIYIDTTDLHLYRYDISTRTKTDLLKNFVAPETTPINMGGQTQVYGSKVYYLNMYADKTLYVYDETTKKSSQLTADKVADFYIYGDMLYFNQVTMLTNNDLYCVNLKTGAEAEKINSNDVRNMVSDGTYIYATHYNWAGTAGGISRMKLDGSEYVKFSEVNGAKNLTIKDGKLYFINCAIGQDNGNIEYITLSDIHQTSEDLTSTNLSKNIKNVKQFIFDGDDIFYIYNGTIDNSVRRTSFTTLDEGTKIASNKTNPNEIYLYGNDVYYYSYAVTASSSAGFYKVSKTATADGTQELILGYDSKYYGSNIAITSSGNMYFLNYITKLMLGDAHTYQIHLETQTVTKIN